MKVLFITNIPSPYRVDFFNELGKSVDLTVIYEARNFNNRNKNWTENKAENFKEIYLTDEVLSENKKGFKGITKYIEKDKYDLILASEYGAKTLRIAINYMRRKRIPFILNADGGFIREKENPIKKFYKKHLVSSASYWLTSGEYSAKTLQYYGAKKEKIFIYPFTSIRDVDVKMTEKSEKIEIRKKLGIPYDKMVISVGSFFPRKGMDAVIKAAKNCKDTGFYLIGGEPTLEYKTIISEMNIENVHFVRHLLKNELSLYYECADIFALMTHSDVWGLVINEAMAKGLPVITTDMCIAGLEMINKKDNGFLLKPGDFEGLAEKINWILLDEERLKLMSEKALETAKNYTIENMAIKHLEAFKKINIKE